MFFYYPFSIIRLCFFFDKKTSSTRQANVNSNYKINLKTSFVSVGTGELKEKEAKKK